MNTPAITYMGGVGSIAPGSTTKLIGEDENEVKDSIFFYIDRFKDLIKYKLHQIYLSDTESVLFTHPMMFDCAATGVYYPEFTTELPHAYVQLVDGEEYSPEIEQEIHDYVDNRVPDEKRLRGGVVIVNSFPRTDSGKIQRRVLRENSSNSSTIST